MPVADAREDVLLDIRHITICHQRSQRCVLEDIRLSLYPYEVFGIVGESGSGKTTLCRAVMGLLPSGLRMIEGEIRFQGDSLGALSPRQFRSLLGNKIAMIMQNPMSSFNPLRTIGAHLLETFRLHLDVGKKAAIDLAVECLTRVRLPHPENLLNQYPFELSGGMLQRVMIAMTLAMKPDLIVADEPTTALDACNRRSVLQELKKVQLETGAAIMLVTHDMDVIAELADTVAVMRDGKVVETAPCTRLFDAPEHPYTRRLLSARPSFPLQSDAPYSTKGEAVYERTGNRWSQQNFSC